MPEWENCFDKTRAWSTAQFLGFLLLFCAGGFMMRPSNVQQTGDNLFCRDGRGQYYVPQIVDGKPSCPPGQLLVTVIFKDGYRKY